jgi:hypothetical protein
MPHVGSEIDANFYRLIHQMLETPRDDNGPGRRPEMRHSHATAQRIARWDGSRFPDADQFVPIQFRDLTRSGFSFLAASEPRFSTLVVEFGIPPHVLYIAAQVMRSIPVMCHPSGELTRVNDEESERGREGEGETGRESALPGSCAEQGKRMFLVGCRFTRRLRRPS